MILLMQDTSASRNQVWTYSVQVINEARKSEYRVEKLNFTGQFVSVDTLKEFLSQTLLVQMFVVLVICHLAMV